MITLLVYSLWSIWIATWLSSWCHRRRIIILEAAGRKFYNFFAKLSQNEDPLCPHYIRQTEELKKRIRKHKSDVIHPNNSNCKKCSEHLVTCSKMKEPYFNIYPFLFEENEYLREFKERQYIMNWKSQLNSYH